jgi:peptidyl-prolyl cis-trans isomerase B (cyclophilin B)
MNDGTFMIELFPEDAPNTVDNFLKLVESGYYDGMIFHRIVPGFIIQTAKVFELCSTSYR